MKRIIFLLSILSVALSFSVFAGISGDWNTKVAGLEIIFHISESESGKYISTMDSPMQGAFGLPMESVSVKGDSITLQMPLLKISVEGVHDPARDIIEGTFIQNGYSIPVTMSRVASNASSTKPLRPQEEAIPGCNYKEEEVTFKNNDLTFAGTLTIPHGETKGVIVLVSGSGSQDRDETILEHKPFAVLADYLACNGWASLRYDDRGVGGSSPGKETDTTFDFAEDALSALEYLAHREEFKKMPIGLAGHSEGALIGMIIAANHPDAISFLISLSGPGLPGKDIMIQQNRLLAIASGADTKTADDVESSAKGLYDLYNMFSSSEELTSAISSTLSRNNVANADQQLKLLTSPWFIKFVTTDPAEFMQKIKCPVLAIAGEFDAQVEPESSLSTMQKTIGDIKCVTIPRANHLLQQSEKFVGSTDYYSIQETISPEALKAISEWLDSLSER